MSHVFISYKHEDIDFEQLLISKLKEDGLTIWQDADSQRLPAGANWREEIDRAIKNAFAMIVIITPESQSSAYVAYEIGYACGAGVQIIPLIRRGNEVHSRLVVFHHLDFTMNNPDARPWHILLARLKECKAAYEEREIDCAKDIAALIDLLRGTHEETTSRAINILAKTGMPSVGYLLRALHDDNVRVRRNAVRILGKIREPVTVYELFAALNDDDKNVQNSAILALSEIGISSVPGLKEVLLDYKRDESLRANVAQALGQVGGYDAVCCLLEVLDNDKARNVRRQAIIALGSIGHTRATDSLLNVLTSDKDDDVRLQAALALGRIRFSDAIPAIRNVLKSEENMEIRATLSRVIELLKDNVSTE